MPRRKNAGQTPVDDAATEKSSSASAAGTNSVATSTAVANANRVDQQQMTSSSSSSSEPPPPTIMKTASSSAISWNSKPLLIVFSGLLLIAVYAMLSSSSPGDGTGAGVYESLVGKQWRSLDMLKEDIPPKVLEHVKIRRDSIKIHEKSLDIQNKKVFYRECPPNSLVPSSGKTLLLLHGAAFTSRTWQDTLPTIQTMCSLGHRVLAVDLPGYGKSAKSGVDPGEFMIELIGALSPNRAPIVVSPSMSGTFSLKLLTTRPDLMCGYVPVAPVSTGAYESQFASVRVPTMIVYGELDKGLGRTSAKHLSNIPTATKPQMITRGRHPCYLDNPERWHKLLHNFIGHLDGKC